MPERAEQPADVLRVCALYPDLMNIYADRGNLIVLERRCAWRGIGFELAASRARRAARRRAATTCTTSAAARTATSACARRTCWSARRRRCAAAAAREAIVLGVCGGYQLLGSSYTLDEERIEGVGLLDVQTVRVAGPRLIGNVAIAPEGLPGAPSGEVLAGFENHGGRTSLGAGQQPLGRVLRGHGNDGRSGHEGARSGNTIGTYLHGPLLPKNVWFADWLIARALGLAPAELGALPDEIERRDARGGAAGRRGLTGAQEATAKRAKRSASRAGTSARTRTPSAVSSRVTSPASSCSSARLPPSA